MILYFEKNSLLIMKLKLNGKEVESKGWSLTHGAYVGVAPVDNNGVNFQERMKEIHQELIKLQAESNELMNTITQNFRELGL